MDAGGRLRVRSALNPALFLSVFVTLPLVYMASLFPGGPPWWVVLIAVAPVITAVLGFAYLLIVDPGKLQSEDYQVRMRSLDLIQEKGDRFPVSAASIQAISNPDLPLIGEPPDGEAS